MTAAHSDPSRGPPRCGLCGGAGAPWMTKHGYPILRCTRCDNGFVPMDRIPKDLESIYSKAYFEGEQETGYPSYLADAEIAEKNFGERLDLLESMGLPGRRLLDVGAALGILLRLARRRGWDASGVEIAPDCAVEAARLSGAAVACGDFSTVPLVGPYHAIVMLDVIEHFRDPVACVRRAYELLAPGGALLIETGDIAAAVARLLGKNWWFIDPPQHLFYFSREGCVSLVRRSGFTGEIRVTRPTRLVSLTNIAFKLAAGAPAGPLREALDRASRAKLPGALPLNFRDGIQIVARKP